MFGCGLSFPVYRCLLGSHLPSPAVSGSSSWPAVSSRVVDPHISLSIRPAAFKPNSRSLCLYPRRPFLFQTTRPEVDSMAASLTVLRKRGKSLVAYALVVSDRVLVHRWVSQLSRLLYSYWSSTSVCRRLQPFDRRKVRVPVYVMDRVYLFPSYRSRTICMR